MYIKQTNKPKPLKEIMKDDLDVSNMEPGWKRGMVLKVYKAKIRELAGDGFLADLRGARMTQRNEADYRNPTLIIRMKPGSPWRHELHQRRMQIRAAINDRLGCEFIRQVTIN